MNKPVLKEFDISEVNSPLLDSGELTPEAQAMTKMEFLDKYVKDTVMGLLELLKAKDISCLLEFADDECVITNGHVHSDDYIFLAAAGCFNIGPEDKVSPKALRKLIEAGIKNFNYISEKDSGK